MFIKRLIGAFVLLFALSACAGGLGVQTQLRPDVERSYSLRALSFSALPDLEVSEAEGYYPVADVVWRGDPLGPRIPQIGAMFETAFERNKPILQGNRPIVVNIQLERFHGVTQRTRFSFGGVYNIIFVMTVRDAATGEVIEPPRRIVADLDAPGGAKAVQLDQSGQTQKVRVVNFLSAVLRRELL